MSVVNDRSCCMSPFITRCGDRSKRSLQGRHHLTPTPVGVMDRSEFLRRCAMVLADRNLRPGIRLRARYKGETHSCEVFEAEKGVRFRIPDGRDFRSVSGAGTAVMGGIACNGWAFWSLEDPATAE